MWHNITNECLSEIIQKHETSLEQTYTNNVMPKEINSNNLASVHYYKQNEYGFC